LKKAKKKVRKTAPRARRAPAAIDQSVPEMILAAVRIAEHSVGIQAAPFAWRRAIHERRAPVLAPVTRRHVRP
jgi:hypothetical protein